MASPDKKAFALRIDPALWAEIERLAAQDLRSVNAEVEFLLREALSRRGVRVKAPAARGLVEDPKKVAGSEAGDAV
jgi:hypothetical protein